MTESTFLATMLGPVELLIVIVTVATMVVLLLRRVGMPGMSNPNLAPCPDCGRAISIRARSCPQCGRPLL